ncbi:MAG TPA: hypothetical protein VGK74_26290 [Symbiobacteriaceae bacterium]
MRLGLNGRRLPPHKFTGYGLIFVGIVVMLIALPVYIYAAIIGGIIAYLGHTLRGR